MVDDEPDLCEILSFNLSTAGYDVSTASSAEEALSIGIEDFNLLLLDVMMPGRSGFELARQLKAQKDTKHIPIIFLTAKDTEEDLLKGFHLGADDYVSKPFSIREVTARVKAVLGRTGSIDNGKLKIENDSAPYTLSHEGLTMDSTSKRAAIDGEEIQLTRTEFDLLWLLLSHRGQVFSRADILENVWPQDVIVNDRSVDVCITRLRKKLGRYATHIINKQGFGYCFAN